MKRKTKYIFLVLLSLIFFPSVCVYAVNDPIQAIGNLSNILVMIFKSMGGIFLLYGIAKIGSSFKTQDPNSRTQGIMTFAGGLIIFFAREILRAIGINV